MRVNADPPSSSKAFAKEALTLLACAIFIVFLRFFARIQAGGLRKLRLDDWGMIVAVALFAFLITSFRLLIITTHIDSTVNPKNMGVASSSGLDNNGMTDKYRANLDPASVEYQLRVAGSKHHVIAWSLYTSTLWCLKLCIAVYYTQLTGGLSHMKIRIQIAYIAIGVTFLVIITTIFGACRPFNHYWQINPNPGDQCMPAISPLWCYVIVILNVLTDLYLLHIPIHMLWNAQISRIKKFFLIMLFSGGIFVIVASILRAYFVLNAGRRGGAEAARWGTREAFVAFVIGNAPLIYGSGRIWLRKFKQSKACAWIRSRTKGWLSVNKFNALFSQINCSRARTASKKATPGKDLAMLNLKARTQPKSDSTSEQGHSSPLSWGHLRLGGRINTQVNSGDITHSDPEPKIAIQATRGTKVDVESVKSRNSEPETIETSGRHSRTDSEAGLGPSMMNSPSQTSNYGRILELPSGERSVRQSIFRIRDYSRQRQSTMLEFPNDTKWFSDDSS